MRRIVIRIIAPFIQRFSKWYFSKARSFEYKSIKGTVLPGVFYPHFTISTKLLMDFIEPLELAEKSVLELGCGTGFISVFAAQKGANVTASDINPKAIENVELNAKNNKLELITALSDLFVNIPKQQFDYILINPPYYRKKPQNRAEEAWFCGEGFEYFKKLFSTIGDYFRNDSKVILILSEDCELERIKEIAKENNLSFNLLLKQKKWGEDNFIFSLKSI